MHKIILFLSFFMLFFTSINAQLEISKLSDKNFVQSGEEWIYTIQYKCASTTQNCNDVTITDALPPEVEFVNAIGSVHTTNESYNAGSHTVTFDFINPLPAGSTAEVKIRVRFPNGEVPDGTIAINEATMDASNAPAITSNPVEVEVDAVDRINSIKTLSSGGPVDGITTWTVRVCNDFDGSTQLGSLNPDGDVIVVDQLPAGAIYVNSNGGGVYDMASHTVTWTNSPSALEVGECRWLSVSVQLPSSNFSTGDMVTNNATVTWTPLGETEQTGPVGDMYTIISPNPRFKLGKENDRTEVAPFESGTYSIDFDNNGTESLPGFCFIDTIPDYVTVDVIQTGEWSSGLTTLDSAYTSIATDLNPSWNQISVDHMWNSAWLDMDDYLGANEKVTAIRVCLGPSDIHAGYNNYQPTEIRYTIDSDAPGNFVIENCVDYEADIDLSGFNVTGSQCNTTTVEEIDPTAIAQPYKQLTSDQPEAFAPGDTVTYEVRIKAACGYSPITGPGMYDLLPADLIYVPNSQMYASWWTNWGVPAPTFTETPNYNGSGQTLLAWTWPNDPDFVIPGCQEIYWNYSAVVGPYALPGSSSVLNTLIMGGDNIDQCWGNTDLEDVFDINGNGDTDEMLCGHTAEIDVIAVPSLESEKLVFGQLDSVWSKFPLTGQTVPGGIADYQLFIRNPGNQPMTDIVIVDVLSHLGDTEILDPSIPRDTEWEPFLAAPVSAPPGVTVFYSTECNPCRDEVAGPSDPSPFPTGCTPPNWSAVPPSDISSVCALKFDFGSVVLMPGDELLLEWPMRAPVNAPTNGEIAWNSFAYAANRVCENYYPKQDPNAVATSCDPLLPSEPIKVGIEILPIMPAAHGDLVWIDSNEDGIQDVGEMGLDGVRVEIYQDNGDGVTDPATDLFVNFTLTTGGGLYIFPDLAPGDYYVTFYPPPNYALSPANVNGNGNDDTDSDGIGAVYNGFPVAYSEIVTLAENDIDLTCDLGLFPSDPPVASQGNYVWFDKNADGIQNESNADGLNGVIVNIYQDNGDGIADPNGADGTPVAVDTTANDVNGNPGYYLLLDLMPGDYFLEFIKPQIALVATIQGPTGIDDPADSDIDTINHLTEVHTLEAFEYNPTCDAGFRLLTGNMSLGNFVWMDTDCDGIYEPSEGEEGINGVVLNLYVDTDGNGAFTPGVDEFYTTTTTATSGGSTGFYLFTELPEVDFIVQVDPNNFLPSGPLFMLNNSAGNGNPDPNLDMNNDDNGIPLAGYGVVSNPITLMENTEPTNDGDSDPNSNLTLDFGFYLPLCSDLSDETEDFSICSGETIPELSVVVSGFNADSAEFVYYTSQQTSGLSVYSGGTSLGLGTMNGDTSILNNVVLPANSTTSPVVYYVYARIAPTPEADSCKVYQEIVVTVNPLEDAGFTYDGTLCIDDDGPAATISGTTGGTFSFSPDPGDGATINSSTGVIGNAVEGTTYTVEYSVTGSCPSSSTQTIIGESCCPDTNCLELEIIINNE